MNETTTHRDLTAILADLADFTVASTGARATVLYHELEDAVRARLAPLPEGEAERVAAEADRAARTMAPPVPGVTRNAGYIVRAVIHMHPHEDGLLEAWLVAAEKTERGYWVTWNAYQRDDSQAGTLAYDGGHYFQHPAGTKINRRDALADLAVRAGTMAGVAERIAIEVERYPNQTSREDKRMAARLRKYFDR